VFGFSFSELVVICLVALVFVGPQKLPGLLRTLGEWIRKARNMVSDMRTQSGIDDILRAEGLQGGIHELRTIMRGQHIPWNPSPSPTTDSPSDGSGAGTTEQLGTSPYPQQDQYQGIQIDPTKEYPPEGVDAFGALPDDLVGLPPPGWMPDQIAELAPTADAGAFASANAEPAAPALEAPGEPVATPQAAGDPSDPSRPVDKTEAVA